MIKATKNGDFSTKNVVDEYSRLNDYTSDSTYMFPYETPLPRQSTTISDISAIPTKEAPPQR